MSLWCDVCFCNVSDSPVAWSQHIRGSKHRSQAAAAGATTATAAAAANRRNSILAAAASRSTSKVVVSHNTHGHNDDKKPKDEIKIAVHDTSADMITFQEAIGGKSATVHQLDGTSESDQDLSLDDKLPAVVAASTKEEATLAYFLPKSTGAGFSKKKESALFSATSIDKHSGGALFGYRFPSIDEDIPDDVGGHPVGMEEGVYLNTHEPFCFVTVGVQGAGKSHTTSCVLESCLVPLDTCNIVKLSSPMTSLVLHYDHSSKSVCEAAGLLSPNPSFQAAMSRFDDNIELAVPRSKAVILVSPTFYTQRKKFYGDYCTVKPLLFRWSTLGADHIKRIMRIESGDNQLYVAVFLDLLREYQRKGK
jgi:hypothetical protein